MDSGHFLKQVDQAVGRYERAVKHPRRGARAPAQLITISRQIGAGGRDIAERLAAGLGCTVWGREILDVLAGQAGGNYQARMFAALDESTQGAIDELVSDFFGAVGRHTYHYLLPRAVFTIAQHDAVFLGRGAHLLLPRAFHVCITASPERRAQALADRERIGRESARERIRDTDRRRGAFIREFRHSIQAGARDVGREFDLTVNTDRLTIDAAASVIRHGFDLFRKSRT